MMVGLQVRRGSAVTGGASLLSQEGLPPWAAALSDAQLHRCCAACFSPFSPTCRFPCEQGPCHGTVAYCSLLCRDLDLSCHSSSGECRLLAFSFGQEPQYSFESFDGSCDLRAALRLLHHHTSSNHTSNFLAALRDGAPLETCRLGGLLSNRSSLMPLKLPGADKEQENGELLLAHDLRESARLMHYARFSTSTEVLEGYTASQEGCYSGIHMCARMARSQHHETDVENTHGSALANWNMVSGHGCKHAIGHAQSDSTYSAEISQSEVDSMTMTRDEEVLLIEEVICQVVTNGVCILVDAWTTDGDSKLAHNDTGIMGLSEPNDLGTAVYGPILSWMNHSCRPNAFYSFVLGGPTIPEKALDITFVPDSEVKDIQEAWGLHLSVLDRAHNEGKREYGPHACLYSINSINELEPVCISYIDLLQPKSTRQLELWLKYRFHCECARCNADLSSFVDEALENIGLWGNQCEVSVRIQEEAQQGLDAFLNSNDPWTCSRMLEEALLRILHEASLVCCGSPQSAEEGGSGVCLKVADERHEKNLRVHLMHHACLDMYMTLASSYHVLAPGFMGTDGAGTPPRCKQGYVEECNFLKEDSSVSGSGEVKCSMASAAYAFVVAATLQRFLESGEHGLIGMAARCWLQAAEALLAFMPELDGQFRNITPHSELQDLCVLINESDHLEPVVVASFLQSGTFFPGHGSLVDAIRCCKTSIDLLRCTAVLLWPFLQASSPFLSCIETPFDIGQVLYPLSGKLADSLEDEDVWSHYRPQVYICTFCCLQHGLKLMRICAGSSERRTRAVQRLFRWALGRRP